MHITSSKLIHDCSSHGRTWLGIHELEYNHKDHHGRYFMVTRGKEIVPSNQKKPDAVVIIAKYPLESGENSLILTWEHRIPVGDKELGFPAGLIDDKDYIVDGIRTDDVKLAAMRAAVREMKEETGLDFTPTECSPSNLYSSAGLTNESIIYVFGIAKGDLDYNRQEIGEDITVIFATKDDIDDLVKKETCHSKSAWPFLWHFSQVGL